MTGKACVSVTKYYDSKAGRMGLKKRPVLIIGKSDLTDYVALPISRITRSQHIDPEYDYPLEIADYPLMNLTAKSYVRAHKQFVVNAAEITETICDFRSAYPEAYLDALKLVERFQSELLNSAL